MHDILFENVRSLYGGDIREMVKALGAEIGLDADQFNTCIDEQRYVGLVQQQDQYRRDLGVRTRPTLDVNGQLVVGPQPFEVFQSVIEPMLTE
jgi:predicted DsbA family dithiol-disulfide isomerase